MSLATDRTGLPALLDGLIIDGRAELDQEDAREFSVVKPVIEGLEAIELVPDRGGDLGRLAPGHHLHVRREEPQHALLSKPPGQPADGGRVGRRLARARRRGPVGAEDHRADDFIAPLRAVSQLELQRCKVLGWHADDPRAAVAHRGD
jgi:hypothetical protein